MCKNFDSIVLWFGIVVLSCMVGRWLPDELGMPAQPPKTDSPAQRR